MPLDENDLQIIAGAIARGGKIWEDETLNPIKRKIKLHRLESTGRQCCYCRRDFTDEFFMVIDIEHVLPKEHFRDFMFQLFNLSVSCKRCNMRIKGQRTDFLVDPVLVAQHPEDSAQYLLSHPNIDNYFDNLDYHAVIINNKKSIKYVPRTDKGHYTYAFFRLDQMEIETLNEAQGINIAETGLSDNIPPDIAVEANKLLAKL